MSREIVTTDGSKHPSLNDLMSFEHVILITEDGRIIDKLPGGREFWAPEVYWADSTVEIQGDGWCLMDGYSSQYLYSGPVMHSSESIGGQMESDILTTPGLYVAVVVMELECEDHPTDDCDCDDIVGWAVARKEIPHLNVTHAPGSLFSCMGCRLQCHCLGKAGTPCTHCHQSGKA